MALMLAGLKSINTEIWSAARLDGVSFWRLYVVVIIPMMKFTFLTCAILLSLGVVKTYDIVLAMTGGGPGTSTWTPAYFVMNAYSTGGNIGYASSAAVMMLLLTVAIFLPLVLLTALRNCPGRGAGYMTASADTVAAARAARRPVRRPKRAIRGSTVANLVFLSTCAAFVSIPLYVVVVTSFKRMDQIALGQIFALRTTWTLEPWWKAWAEVCAGMTCEGVRHGFFTSLSILFPSLGLSVALSCMTGYALALKWANHFSLFSFFAPSCRSRSS